MAELPARLDRQAADDSPALAAPTPKSAEATGPAPAGASAWPPGAAGPRPLTLDAAMPKMKTHSGAKKRFKVTGTGKVRGHHAFTSHILEKKSPKRKRTLGSPAILSSRRPAVKKLLGVGK